MKFLPLLVVCLLLFGCNGHKEKSTENASQKGSTLSDSSIFGRSRNASATEAGDTTQEELDDENLQLDEANLQKIVVYRRDGAMWITGNIRMDYRIVGYAQPDTTSKKMILLSVFTKEVEGNPLGCPYGSYYDCRGVNDNGLDLKYVGDAGEFINANIIESNSLSGSVSIKGVVYIEKKWVDFE